MADKRQEQPSKEKEQVWRDRKHIMWFPIGFTVYSVSNGRVYVDRGLLNTVSDQTLLYRVTDLQLRRSLWQKIFGTGTLVLFSKVDVDHEILLENISRPREVAAMFSEMVEDARRSQNIVGKEFYGSAGCQGHHGDLDDGGEFVQDDMPDM